MDTWLFYLFSALLLFTAFKTISHSHPANSAFYLASSMILLAGIFFIMGAPFLAGLQLIIYAGAVMVLFVMVVMLFGFQAEKLDLLKSPGWLAPAFLFGLFFGIISLMALSRPPLNNKMEIFSANKIALLLFTKYVLIFELIGIALLLIALGVTALSRLDKD